MGAYLKNCLIFLLLLFSVTRCYPQLKAVIYDFDGLDINATDLPEGDYRKSDLTYKVAANPLAANDMVGDRCLKLNLTWNTGNGVFGRSSSRFIELDPLQDNFNFFFYNPVSNNQNATFDVVITEDDNQSYAYEIASDDTWKKTITVSGSSSWQFISIPLKDFVDSNTGGNGIFDAAFSGNKGMLLMTEFRFTRSSSGLASPVFYIDNINFSQGELPHGGSLLDLPAKNSDDFCRIGAYHSEPRGQENLIPQVVESYFPSSGRKIKYANYFIDFAKDGTTVPKELPGNEVQLLLNNGYTPVITWEPMFKGYSRLDPVQPRLDNIISGQYDAYLTSFANKVKSFSDTVIIRFMHEFDGDWYSWSIVHNNEDPAKFVAAWKHVVNLFRANGATKVKWMWCINADYFPRRAFNWLPPAYPGDSYVDIVATDVYNNHYPIDLPWWRSFRWQIAESYFYLAKYFPTRPLFICELGCRERFSSENTSSETKGAWYARMDKELQSEFHKVRGLLFFDAKADQNWLMNSSSNALQSLSDNIWNDNYYFNSSTPVSSCSGTGSITREVWNNIAGYSISSIPVTTTPSSTGSLTIFKSPANVADNYGQRIRGYVCPPLTGNYIFWIASDDNSELWLSTNDLPANRQKIASVTGWTASQEWTKYPSQQSVSKYLVAGQKYYIEALHKEVSQGDHLEVGWQLPGGSLERPIPGLRLMPYNSPSQPPPVNGFAVIGDYGSNSSDEAAVANMVRSWQPGYIITVGDNNYPDGSSSSIDANVGKYYHDYIFPYTGAYGSGASANQFFPSVGNHDYHVAGAVPYYNYFTLPGNERYYDFVKGDIHFYAINSNPEEPDGTSSTSVQALWLKNKLASSTSKWNIVFFHHPPYCSDSVHMNTSLYMAWPFQQWGADVVLAGHAHIYERILRKGITYFINGLGGESKFGYFPNPVEGSAVRYSDNYGAMKVEEKTDTLRFKFYSLGNVLVDDYPIYKPSTLNTLRAEGCDAFITPAGSTSFCEAGNVLLRTDSVAERKYQWLRNEKEIAGATQSSYLASIDGDYQIRIGQEGCTAWSAPLNVNVSGTLNARITAGGKTNLCRNEKVWLFATTCDDYQYQWKRDGEDINGAIANTYLADIPGTYQVMIINGSSVAWSSLTIITLDDCGSDSLSTPVNNALATTEKKAVIKNQIVNNFFRVNVYPNPTTGLFTFDFCLEDNSESDLEVRVLNSVGQTVYRTAPKRFSGCLKDTIELNNELATGVYFLQIRIGNRTENVKLLLNR